MYEEETDSEPEVEESQYTPEDEFIEEQEEKLKEQKQQGPKRKNKYSIT